MATLTRVLHRTGLGLHSNLVTLQSCLCFGRSTANHRIIAFQSQMVMVMAIRQRPLVALLLLTTTTTTICSICSISSATKPNTCREQMKDELPLGHSKVSICECGDSETQTAYKGTIFAAVQPAAAAAAHRVHFANRRPSHHLS